MVPIIKMTKAPIDIIKVSIDSNIIFTFLPPIMSFLSM